MIDIKIEFGELHIYVHDALKEQELLARLKALDQAVTKDATDLTKAVDDSKTT